MTFAPPSATEPADQRPGISGVPAAPGVQEGLPTVRLGPAAAGRCRRRVHLDADPTAPRGLRSAADEGVRSRLADADVHRESVLAAVRAALVCREGVDWNPAGTERPDVVLEPVLRSGTRFGTPDLLVWAGDGYRPIVIRSHRTTDQGTGAIVADLRSPLATSTDARRRARSHPADALTLAHHHRLLAQLGLAGAVPVGGVIGRGGVIGPESNGSGGGTGPGRSVGADSAEPADRTDSAGNAGSADRAESAGQAGDEAVVVWHDLDLSGASVLADYDSRFTDRMAVARAAASGGTPLALASRIGECRRCPWWPVCSGELAAVQDVSLVVTGTDVDLLRAAGYRTAAQLADADPATLAALPLTGGDPATVRVRARAYLAGVPLVRRTDRVFVRRADLELDVDMESFLEDGAYLWGTYLSGPAVELLGLTGGYRAFVSWQPLPDRDEGRAFAEFWSFLRTLRAAAAGNGLTFAAYCYSRSAEERWLRSTPLRYPDVPGMPTPAEIAEFCSSPEWVDIYQEIRDQFVVPGSMKLKVLAQVTGFRWRDAAPGGENSMAWYRQAVGRGPGGSAPAGRRDAAGGPVRPADPDSADRILQYNEDDVLATLALRRWMVEHAPDVPSVADLDTN